ncbi:hypothetical protein GS399_13065 [Pedobacter sp. HMF7647]|uniref:DinB family protein n=1 Tax=Hufsiella arboris TaxID=2695275 RepID=A0A7K1YCT2_9SPHI|nr:DinB family protein [Hufsiella arboris]MXV51909.1 hypothetical protein [Hufsiella arboris]
MKSTAQSLREKLEETFSGQPWYGTCIYDIIDKVDFETSFIKTSETAHTIAEILLHMLSWTEEVIDRLNEKPAGVPFSGDWPETSETDEQKWLLWKDDLKLVNASLIKAIEGLPEEKWDQLINDDRGNDSIDTYAELVDGFIQHQVYHAGQIAILNKIIAG